MRRGDAAAASELDDPAAANAVRVQQPDDRWRRSAGQFSECSVVDDGEVG